MGSLITEGLVGVVHPRLVRLLLIAEGRGGGGRR